MQIPTTFSGAQSGQRNRASAHATPNTYPPDSIRFSGRQNRSRKIDKPSAVIAAITLGLSSLFGGYIGQSFRNYYRPLPPLESFAPAANPADMAEFKWYVRDAGGRHHEVTPEELSPKKRAYFEAIEQYVTDTIQFALRYRPDLMQNFELNDTRIKLHEGGSFYSDRHQSWQYGHSAAGGFEKDSLSFATKLPTANNRNIVIHETAGHFVERIDGWDGNLPGLSEAQQQQLDEALKTEVDKIAAGKHSALDPYAYSYEMGGVTRYHHQRGPVEQKVEALSVAIEAFFENTQELADTNTTLYRILRSFFRYDPLTDKPYQPDSDEKTELVQRQGGIFPGKTEPVALAIDSAGATLLLSSLVLYARRRQLRTRGKKPQ